MTEPLIVVEEGRRLAHRLGAANQMSATSPARIHEAMKTFPRGAVWVARPRTLVKLLAATESLAGTPHRLLLLGRPRPRDAVFLRAVFDTVIDSDDGHQLLPPAELLEALRAPRRSDLFIGGAVIPSAKRLLLIRGDLTSIVVPFSWFTPRPKGPRPDFSAFDVVDCGQTVRLGAYEAAADAILYEFDAAFRKQEKKRRRSADTSLGGALRRLRLQRGLGRDDFPGVSEKTVARIERGEVKAPHGETLATIAATLGVEAGDLASY